MCAVRLARACPTAAGRRISCAGCPSPTSHGTSSRSSTARARPAPTACSTRPTERAATFAERYAGRVAELDGAGARRGRWPSCGAISELVGRAGNYADAALRRRHRRPRERRADAARAGARRRRSRPQLAVLRARVGRARRRARRGAARAPTGLDDGAPPPAHRAPLPPPPAQRARGEDPRREVGHRRERLVAAVRRADLARSRSTCPTRTSRSRWTSRSRACSPPTARCARTAAEARHRRARAGAAHARATSSTRCWHDKATDDRLRHYPSWLASRNLANEASDESVAGARRRRARRATTSRSAGTA